MIVNVRVINLHFQIPTSFVIILVITATTAMNFSVKKTATVMRKPALRMPSLYSGDASVNNKHMHMGIFVYTNHS